DVVDAGVEQILDAFAEQLFLVGGQGAGIFVETFVGAELQRIDENADHHHIGGFSGAANQIDMAIVQIAHGGNESNAFAGPLVCSQQGSHGSNGRNSLHITKRPAL